MARSSSPAWHGTSALLLLALTVPGGAFSSSDASGKARTVEGIAFAERHEGDGISLRLHNAALLRYKVLFRGYVVGLYLPDGADPDTVLGKVPKRLEFEYFWEIPGPEFAKAGEEILARNVDAQTLASLRDRLDRIRRAYRDVKPGDRYALTYRPGAGTELSYNGAPLLVVEGDDFASAYFSIWLGPAPLDERLKKALLWGG